MQTKHVLYQNLIPCVSFVSIHLVPMVHEQTWERKVQKTSKLLNWRIKDKWFFWVSSTSDGALLPIQVIFTGKTNCSLTTTLDAKLCLDYELHFIMIDNH